MSGLIEDVWILISTAFKLLEFHAASEKFNCTFMRESSNNNKKGK